MKATSRNVVLYTASVAGVLTSSDFSPSPCTLEVGEVGARNPYSVVWCCTSTVRWVYQSLFAEKQLPGKVFDERETHFSCQHEHFCCNLLRNTWYLMSESSSHNNPAEIPVRCCLVFLTSSLGLSHGQQLNL